MLKGVLINYSQSVKRVYNKTGKKPKFHKYNPNKQSFYIPSQVQKIENGLIKIPSNQKFSVKGISKIKVAKQYIEKFNITEIKEPRYTYKNGKWYLTGCYEDNINVKQKETTFIGLDWGIKNFMTTSTGEYLNYPEEVSREYMRIRKLQSIKDKKKKDSNNYKKVLNKLSKAYERFDNLKNNFIEQTTTKLCRDYNVAVEDLTNAKIVSSNRNRRRLQMIAPRGNFVEKLKWKCLKFGTHFVEVNPAYTSQECSNCHKRHYITLEDRIFKCDCGLELDRDVNAAINIAARGICNTL